MYNNSYEEYMRNSLGYNQMPMMNMNQMNMMPEMYETEGNFMCDQTSVEDMYPEIYRIIYPMICKVCMAVNENITEDLVSRITNEVYMNVEHMEIVNETRSSSIRSSKRAQEPVSLKTPCSGWWTPDWCTRSIAAVLPACLSQPMTICPHLRSILWM